MTQKLYAAQWQFSGGHCDGTDQVYNWHITGMSVVPPNDWRARLLVDRPVVLRGVELVKIGGTETIWWMVGNTLGGGADPLLWLGPGENHGKVWFPDDTGIIVPANLTTEYLDLHGSCKAPQKQHWWQKTPPDPGVGFLLIVYYTDQ